MFDKRPAEGTYKIFNKAPLSLNPPKPQIVDLLDGVKYGQIAGYRNNGSSPNNLVSPHISYNVTLYYIVIIQWIVEHKAGSENEIFLINKATRQYAGPSVPPEVCYFFTLISAHCWVRLHGVQGQTLRGTDDITVWTVVEVRKNEYLYVLSTTIFPMPCLTFYVFSIMLEYDLAWTLPDDKNRTPVSIASPFSTVCWFWSHDRLCLMLLWNMMRDKSGSSKSNKARLLMAEWVAESSLDFSTLRSTISNPNSDRRLIVACWLALNWNCDSTRQSVWKMCRYHCKEW